MTWTELRAFLATEKSRRLPYFERHIRELALVGFRLATTEMAELYGKLIGTYDKESGIWPYFDDRKSTYPSIRRTKPNENGILAYGTHARSEDINEAIESLASIHAPDLDADRAWLMPVVDGEEYVSWEFDVMLGTEAEVLAALRVAVARADGARLA